MAMKYAGRADRLSDIIYLKEFIISWIEETSSQLLGCNAIDAKLFAIWDKLPENTNLKKSSNQFNRSEDKRVYVICGKEFQIHITIGNLLENLAIMQGNFGERVKKAQQSITDWKSITHSFRVTYQCKQAIEQGVITFPCKEIDFLRDLRGGKFNFLRDGIDVRLDQLIEETEQAMARSDLPDEVDWNWCERFILDCYGA
jgi:hypothetical protein